MSCAVGRTCPSGGRRSTQVLVPFEIAYVRLERPPAISSADSGLSPASGTCSAKYGRRRSRSTPALVSVASSAMLLLSACGPERRPAGSAPFRRQRGASGDARGARLDRLAVALRVAGDAADRHVHPEARRGALLLGLAAPEPVLAVLAGPVPAGREHRALHAHGTGLAF